MVNLDLIPRHKPCVIWCECKEDADEFFEAMVKHYPEKTERWLDGSRWSEKYNCYNPGFYNHQPLLYDRKAYYSEGGVEILRFADICIGDELSESEQSVELLFGLEV